MTRPKTQLKLIKETVAIHVIDELPSTDVFFPQEGKYRYLVGSY